MADWTAALPDTAVEGELTHIEDHNKIVAAIAEARSNVDGIDTRLGAIEAGGGNYATEQYVDDAVAGIEVPDTSGFATKAEVNSATANLAAKTYVDTAIANVPQPLAPRAPGVQYKVVAGALRKSGGTWSLISDEGHTPSNIVSVTDRGTDLRIEYGFTASKVVSLVATPDETYAVQGYSFGASVGLSGATIKIMNTKQSPIGGYCAYSSSGWTVAAGNLLEATPKTGGPDNVITVTHPLPSPEDSLFLSITGRGSGKYLYRCEGAGWIRDDSGRGYTHVGIYDLAGAPVTAFKTDMKFFLTRLSAPSPTQIAPSELPEGMTNIWIYGLMEV